MTKRSFWTKERALPGQSAVDGTAETYWVLKLVHPPGAAAMVIGAAAGGYLAWKLFRDHGVVLLLVALTLGAFLGAWAGVLLYWLVRLIFAIMD